jgi:rhamnosyltransferase
MDKKPKIAVLLATYNGFENVLEQINSILSQNDVSVYIFVRDDGSVDGTEQLLLNSVSCHPQNITIITDQNGPSGSAAANFFLILQSIDVENFDFIAFADQDDVWLPSKLISAAKQITSNAGGGYSSNLTVWDPHRKNTQQLVKRSAQKKLDYLFQGASAGCTYVLDQNAALLVKSRMLGLSDRYCSNISHDWIIYAICRSAGRKWYHDADSHILYRQHSSNVYGARLGIFGFVSRIQMLSSGWYKEHILWLAYVINNNDSEHNVLKMLKRSSFADRWRLAWESCDFRRSTAEVWLLRFAFILRLIK